MTVQLTVDVTAATPVYEQLRAQIAGHIGAGSLRPGERLPTVRGLAADFGIAVNTVGRAYAELEAAGLVRTGRRVGTSVIGQPTPQVGGDVTAAADRLAQLVSRNGLSHDAGIEILRHALRQVHPEKNPAPAVGVLHSDRDSDHSAGRPAVGRSRIDVMRSPRGVNPLEPGPGQESVWDYPRPPLLQRSRRTVTVRATDVVVARTNQAWRVMETSHPPTWYLPRSAADEGSVRLSRRPSTTCEWKGAATYWDVRIGDRWLEAAAWSYESPTRGFREITGHLAFLAAEPIHPADPADPADAADHRGLTCDVDGELVRPQPGGFYGGWTPMTWPDRSRGSRAPGDGEQLRGMVGRPRQRSNSHPASARSTLATTARTRSTRNRLR